MCGKETQLFKTEVEGTILNVCSDCAKFGNILNPVKEKAEIKQKKQEPEKEIIEIVVSDYADKIKNKREKLKMKQGDMAKKIGIKESVLHHIESKKLKPGIELSKKIEKFLKIRLIEEYTETKTNPTKSKSAEFTIGDIIKIRKK